jgi:hypothetical protein
VERLEKRRRARRWLGWDSLEERIAPAITFQFDYTYDSLGFFAANPAATAVLQQAGQIVGSQLQDNLTGFASDPSLNEYWNSGIPSPSDMSIPVEVSNLTIPANTLVVFVGGSNLTSTLAESNPGSPEMTTGAQDYANLVHSRGQTGALASPPTDWAPWGGMISFGTGWNWNFSGTSGSPGAGQYDFLTVCERELCHLLGYGQAPSWFAQTNLSTQVFDGAHAEAAYGGPVPVDTPGFYWADGTLSAGQSPLMSSSLAAGVRRQMTPLDWAGLADIGWNAATGTDQLVVTTAPPSNVTAGVSFGLTVAAETGSGAVDPTYNGPVTLALASNPGGATLGGTLTGTAVNGVATFSGLTLNKAGSGYTLIASGSGLSSTTTNPFGVSAAAATQWVVTSQPPSSVVAGAGLGVTVTAADSFGNVVTGFNNSVTLAIASNPGGATLGGTVTRNASTGVATFTGVTLNRAGAGYTLIASGSGLLSTTTNPFNVSAAAATQLVITAQPPTSATAGTAFGLTVKAEDALGNVVTTYSGGVSLALAANPGGATLGGTVTMNASAGVATFTGLTLTKAASGYTLAASGGGLSTATTSGITIVAAAASQWVITTQPPASIAVGAAFGLVVTAEDPFGNVATSFTSSVTLATASNPGGATLGGTVTRSASAGVATFTGLALNRIGTGYTLIASGNGLSSATTNPFNVNTAAATQWVITTQPPASATAGSPFSLTVTSEDALGNVDTTYGGSVSLAMAANAAGATLGGTTVLSASAGVATFTGLTLNKAASGYTLAASGGGMSPATTSSITIVAATALQWAVTTQPPAGITAGAGFGLKVTAEDGFGNVITSFNSSATLAIASNPGGATLGGTVTGSASAGVMTFTGLTLNRPGAGYTLIASGSSLSSATTSAFSVTAGAATQWVVTIQPPASATAGSPFSLTATAEDGLGNVDTTYGGSVSLALATNPGGATLSGTTTLTASAGVATFTGLSLNKVAGGYTLAASGGNLSTATTGSIAIVAASAAQWVVTSQPPASILAGAAFGLQVTAEDSYGNVATSFNSSVTLAIGSNPGGASLGGTVTRSASGGVATFTGLSLRKAGAGYTLVASGSGLSSATTSPFNVTAAAATHWVITAQAPASATAGNSFSLTAKAEDSFGNVDTTYTGGVSVALAANPGGATLGGTTTLTASAGVATFTGLSLNKAASGYTLAASGGSLSSATTHSITIVAAAASQWVITTQPPASIAVGTAFGLVVTAEDRFGNVAKSFKSSVTLAIGSNPGGAKLGGTVTRSASGGVVTFTGLTLSQAGASYTLIASGSGLSTATTNPFSVTPG